MVTTSFKIGNVEFKNRVFVASGTFGYGDETIDFLDAKKIGGIFTKSLTLKPRKGNPPPRIIETASGLINSIGLANIGVEKFVTEKLPRLNQFNAVIIPNIAGGTIDEYCKVIEILESANGITAYEINISCPNVKEGGLSFGTDLKATAQITKMVRNLTSKPIIIKLTPNVTRVSEFAKVAESEGADAVSLINTLVGMAVNVKTRKPKISTVTGGLSGPAIKPVALAKVYEVVNAGKIPVFGIGGIANTDDALEFLIVGASAVQIGTTNFINPNISVSIAEGIEKFCLDNDIADVGILVGSLNTSENESVLKSWL